MRVCVSGLGQVGFPTAKYFHDLGLEVWGYDITSEAVQRIKKIGIKATDNWSEIPPIDVHIVCVSTFFTDKPDLKPVYEVCAKIAKRCESNTLVSIESTIVPGTCQDIYKNIFNKNVKLVHVPHRYYAGDEKNHGVKQIRVIGGINKVSLEAGMKFYSDLNIPLHTLSSIEVAEICKISENSYRYIQIAFAEELRMVCEELDLSFAEVRKACNTKWNVEILEARDGIGGHCLPKDINYLSSLTKHNILKNNAILLDKKYREWLEKKK